MGRPAVFVDRDNTIIVDVGFGKNPGMVKLLPRAAEGLRRLADAGFAIVIVTNQSGLGRGYFKQWELDEVHARLREELRAQGADFHALYYCPHRPDEGCQCRKPRPGLILRAASEMDLDLASSFTVGNSDSDLLAGKAAGTRTILISKNSGGPIAGSMEQADFIAPDLAKAAHVILSRKP